MAQRPMLGEALIIKINLDKSMPEANEPGFDEVVIQQTWSKYFI